MITLGSAGLSRWRVILNHWGWLSLAFFALILSWAVYNELAYSNYSYNNIEMLNDGTELVQERDSRYYRSFGKVYLRDPGIGNPYEPIHDAESDSFTALGSRLAVDATMVYFGTEAQPMIDRNSFKKLNKYFYIDAENVYSSHKKITKSLVDGVIIDVSTFEVLSQTSLFARDKNNLYASNQGSICVVRNENNHLTLRALPFNWLVSEQDVYSYNESTCALEKYDFDGLSFAPLDVYYQKDKNGVYYQNELIDGANQETFEVFPRTKAAKDDMNVFIAGKIVENIDNESFMIELTPGGKYTNTARDINGTYNLLSY